MVLGILMLFDRALLAMGNVLAPFASAGFVCLRFISDNWVSKDDRLFLPPGKAEGNGLLLLWNRSGLLGKANLGNAHRAIWLHQLIRRLFSNCNWLPKKTPDYRPRPLPSNNLPTPRPAMWDADAPRVV